MSKLVAAAAVAGVGGTGGAGVLAAHSLGVFGGGGGSGTTAKGTFTAAQVSGTNPGNVLVGTTTAAFQQHSSSIQANALLVMKTLTEEFLTSDCLMAR